MALDNCYAKKFAHLDSMAIYPKPGRALLYTPMADEMNALQIYICLAHFIYSILHADDVYEHPTSIFIIFHMMNNGHQHASNHATLTIVHSNEAPSSSHHQAT